MFLYITAPIQPEPVPGMAGQRRAGQLENYNNQESRGMAMHSDLHRVALSAATDMPVDGFDGITAGRCAGCCGGSAGGWV